MKKKNSREEAIQHLIFHIYNKTDGCGKRDCVLRRTPEFMVGPSPAGGEIDTGHGSQRGKNDKP